MGAYSGIKIFHAMIPLRAGNLPVASSKFHFFNGFSNSTMGHWFTQFNQLVDVEIEKQTKKTLHDCKLLSRVHLIGCQGVKMFLLKDPL